LDNGPQIHLYFVVPDVDNLFDNYQEQNYVTTNNAKYTGWNSETEWIKNKVIQHVLLINLSDF
jgi:hypothetical protein